MARNGEKEGEKAQAAPADDGRRRALTVLTVAGGAAFGCALAVPAAYFVTAPAAAVGAGGAPGGTWVKTVPLAALAESVPRKVAIVADQHDAWTISKDVDLGAVWLVRKGNDVHAWSVVCPHLGCSINAEADGSFGCPCHTSAFDKDGKKIAGPAPRDMDALETKIENDFVHVRFARFRIGTEERTEIGS